MDGVLEHIVNKIGVRLDKVIKHVEDFEVLLLFLVEGVECHVVCVEVHAVE